jgi:hypothetical protein
VLFEHDPPLGCVLEFLLRRAGAPTRMNPNLAEVGKPATAKIAWKGRRSAPERVGVAPAVLNATMLGTEFRRGIG